MCYGLQGLTQSQFLIQILIHIQILTLSMSTRRHVAPRLCCPSEWRDRADGCCFPRTQKLPLGHYARDCQHRIL